MVATRGVGRLPCMARSIDTPSPVTRGAAWLRRLDLAELKLCITFNRGVRRVGLRRLFRVASRLGDGVVWYALIAVLPLFAGRAGLIASLRMAIAGLAGLLLYRALKRRLVRERPFITHHTIVRAAAPLDRFSFRPGIPCTLCVSPSWRSRPSRCLPGCWCPSRC